MGIDLFRTRPSTVTGEQLREEVVLLEWPGGLKTRRKQRQPETFIERLLAMPDVGDDADFNFLRSEASRTEKL